jgi:hypothetical protein
MEIKRAGSEPSTKGPFRLVYRHRSHRSAFSGTRSGTCSRCQRNLRARRADRMAYTSHRHLWMWSRATMGRSYRRDPSRCVVWFSPGEKHWHGATPTAAMTHIAIQEKLDGKVVDWMEKVSDEPYQG